jgi:hypothetical protein
MGDKPLTPEELEMKRRPAAYYKLFAAVYPAIERESAKYQNFYSLTHIFDGYDSLIYIDDAHVTPIGNQLIAARMLDVILAESSDEK